MREKEVREERFASMSTGEGGRVATSIAKDNTVEN